MIRILILAAVALPALAADADVPPVTFSAAAQARCMAGGGCLVLTREKLLEFGVRAFDAGEQSCKGPGA